MAAPGVLRLGATFLVAAASKKICRACHVYPYPPKRFADFGGGSGALRQMHSGRCPVHTMVSRMLGDTHTAEEVTQDTFIDVFTKIDTLQEPDRFVGWVRSVAVNRCLMALRSPWSRRRVADDVDTVAGAEADTSRGRDILAALDSLAPDARMVVWLYCVEGRGHKEIVRLFGKSESFSKSRLQRTLDALSGRAAIQLAAANGEGVSG